jgi:chemotaxis methyl-accepting protein methylase
MLAQLGRINILGTDIDRECLAAAERGQFDEGDFTDTPDDLRARYFTPEPPFVVARAIHEMVHFARRDLLTDPAPGAGYDLIVCRNVLIYFDRDTQERLFDLFHRSLAPDGFLVLGKVETLLGNARSRFAPVDARERIFRRV